ncbi:MAG TPA: hypothetical protein VMF11_09645 [Candidatus Baltobacteraceae bacterium]|nr:hypothetical protein [Candidatus Baltobacteraceae bacterium]
MDLTRAAFLSGGAAASLALLTRSVLARPNAYVFLRPGGSVIAGDVFGHVGFAFATAPEEYIAGAIEMAHHDPSPKGKDFWHAATREPLVRAGAYDNVGLGYQTRYDLYKALEGGGNVAAANRAIAAIAGWRFAAPGHDCLDAVRAVLTAYGLRFNGEEMRTVNPDAFFRMLPARPGELNYPWPGSVIDVSIYSEYGRHGLRDDIVAFAPSVIFEDDTSYNPSSGYPEVALSSFVVRRGHMVLYNRPQFRGAASVIRPDATVNLNQLKWTYKSVGSYVIADKAFDIAAPPITGLAARFSSAAARAAYYRELKSKP